jgi:hypothetical protein
MRRNASNRRSVLLSRRNYGFDAVPIVDYFYVLTHDAVHSYSFYALDGVERIIRERSMGNSKNR